MWNIALTREFSRVTESSDTMRRFLLVFFPKKTLTCFQKHHLFSLLDYIAQVHEVEFLFGITSNTFLQVVDAFQLLGNLCYWNSFFCFRFPDYFFSHPIYNLLFFQTCAGFFLWGHSRALSQCKLYKVNICELKCVKSLCIRSHFEVGWPSILVA